MSEKIKLGELGEVVSGSTPKTNIKDYWDGENLWITPAEIQEDDYYIADTQRKITNLAVEKTNLKLLPKGTVLLSSRAPIGKVAICDNDMYCNQGFKNIICSDRLENRYVYYFLKYNVEYIKSLGRGATFKEISKGIVENLEIPYIEKKEQIEIANKLDKITEILKIKKQQIKQFDEIIKSQFVEMFENKNYEKLSGKELFSFSSGKFLEASKRLENGVPVYGGNGVAWYTDEPLIDFNTIVIGRVGAYCGNVKLIKEPVWITDNAIFIKQFKKDVYNIDFLYYMMELVDFSRFAQFSGQPKITQKPLEEFNYVVPPIQEQIKFSNIVKQIDKQKFEIENSLKEMQELYEALMERYFG